MGVGPDEDEEAIRAQAVELLAGDGYTADAAWVEGRALDLPAALELMRSESSDRINVRG